MDTKGFIQHIRQHLPQSLPISEYNRHYLGRLLKNLPYMTGIYASILKEALRISGKEPAQLRLVDFGGGTGLLSCFAKWVGVGEVIYLDIYEQSAKDAAVIAESLQLKANHYVAGETSALQFVPDVLVSMDVIEHIYDLDMFFKACHELNPDIVQVHVTGANPYNPVLRKRLMALQVRNETQDRIPPVGAKPIDDYRAYRKIRTAWLNEHFADKLSPEEIHTLAEQTRGKTFADMQILTENYLSTGKLPAAPTHPTNTCDPNTGNWSERLFTQKELQSYCKPYGWTCHYSSIGFNTQQANPAKNLMLSALNFFARFLGGNSKRVLPLLRISLPRPSKGGE